LIWFTTYSAHDKEETAVVTAVSMGGRRVD